MSEAPPPTGTPPDLEGYNPAEAMRRGISHISVAYHGVGARINGSRVGRTERRADRAEHTAEFFEAMGEIATRVAGEGANLPPVRYDALDRTTPTVERPDRPDFPQPGDDPLPRQDGVLALQATALRREPVYRDRGRIILEDSELPPDERSGQPQVTFLRQSLAPRPGEPGYDPDQLTYPDPQTREERLAEKRLVRDVRDIRELRRAQATRRRMTGSTGRYAFWRTKIRHAGERLSDRRRVHDGSLSAMDAADRAQARGFDTTTVLHRRLARTDRVLNRTNRDMTRRMDRTADASARDLEKAENKLPRLETKIDSHETKRDEHRDQAAELSQRRAIRKANNAARRKEKIKAGAEAIRGARTKIVSRVSKVVSRDKDKDESDPE